jgi:hypothetical protein
MHDPNPKISNNLTLNLFYFNDTQTSSDIINDIAKNVKLINDGFIGQIGVTKSLKSFFPHGTK